ncbi:MAG: AAC(3) family N-acetyltransferase [Anaerolineae bacterium]|nr:AAC(3) family N-acetyltransferase [Anaerolineae bacterium]
MSVTLEDIRTAVTQMDLAEQPLCVHASLRSFGHVQDGAQTVVEGLLQQGCTVMVPTHSYNAYHIPTPKNGTVDPSVPVYTPDSNAIDAQNMGAIPVYVLHKAGRVRGNHPLDSFTAFGPLASQLAESQSPEDVYAPVRSLEQLGGYIVMMGVGLNRLTALHHAERLAGRPLFRLWAKGADGRPIQARLGGCSEGFVNFDPVLAPIERQVRVGQSLCRVFPVEPMLTLAIAAIRANPMITHCGNADCDECNANVQVAL